MARRHCLFVLLSCQACLLRAFGTGSCPVIRLQDAVVTLRTSFHARTHLCRRRSNAPVMVFPGERDEKSQTADLVGFWQLINSTPDEESGVEKIILRADNQIGGSPSFPEWEGANVSWAGAQMAAGGQWREYAGPTGQRRLAFHLLAPLKGAFERASGERQAMFYDGVVLKLLEPSLKKDEEAKTSIRILGNMTSGVLGGDADARRFRGKFSMVKVDTAQIELVPTVQPFSRPFDTLAQEVEDEIRERDHDPAGMHNRVREEAERLESMAEQREARSEDASWSALDGEGEADATDEGAFGGPPTRTGDVLAAELSKEVECQSKVEQEMQLLREIMNAEANKAEQDRDES